jgi:hypothetical protein
VRRSDRRTAADCSDIADFNDSRECPIDSNDRLGYLLTNGHLALGKMKNPKRSARPIGTLPSASADINNAWDEKFRV